VEEKKEKTSEKMIHIKVPEELHKSIRLKVAHENTSIQAYIVQLLERTVSPAIITYPNGESVRLWDLEDTGSKSWATQIEFFDSEGSFLGGTHFHETYEAEINPDWYERQMGKLQASQSEYARAVKDCLNYIIDARLGRIDPTKMPPPVPEGATLINWP